MDDGLDDTRVTIAIAAVGYLFCPVCVRNFLFLLRVKKSSFVLTQQFSFWISTTGSQVKTSDLRSQSRTELKSALEQQKQQLASLKIAKVTGGAPNKIARIKSVRLAIARILTVIRQNQLKSLREAYSGAKYTPLDLRAKKTRAIRRRLSPAEKNAKTAKQAKKDAYYPKRKYALKA